MTDPSEHMTIDEILAQAAGERLMMSRLYWLTEARLRQTARDAILDLADTMNDAGEVVVTRDELSTLRATEAA